MLINSTFFNSSVLLKSAFKRTEGVDALPWTKTRWPDLISLTASSANYLGKIINFSLNLESK